MLDPGTIVSALAKHEIKSEQPLACFDADQVIETLESATGLDSEALWYELRLWVAGREGWLVPMESSSEIRMPRDSWAPFAPAAVKPVATKAPAAKAPAAAKARGSSTTTRTRRRKQS